VNSPGWPRSAELPRSRSRDKYRDTHPTPAQSRPPTHGAASEPGDSPTNSALPDTTLVARRRLRHLLNTRSAILAVADRSPELSRYKVCRRASYGVPCMKSRSLSQRAKGLAGELRRATPCRLACRNLDHRRDGELSGQSAHEQVATDAMVPARRRSPAPGSLRGLQRHARARGRPPI
jgi:hypothetical protein